MPLVKFGGWLTVTNIVGPFLNYMDRFLVGALLSVTAVAYYTAPFDMMMRLTIIPGAVVGVLFPAFAVSFIQDADRVGLLLGRGLKYVFLAIFPIALVITSLAPEGLRLWLGPAFAQNSSSVLRWLAAGVFVISLATVPYVLIQGAGRPDITAKLHVAELPVYLAALWLLTKKFGIEGTAIAWTGRVILDAVILFFYSRRLVAQSPKFLAKLGITVSGGLAVLYLASLPASLVIRAAFLGVNLLVFGLAGWFWGLGPSERVFLAGTRTEAPVKVHTN
jgi:O-antigen/teichoic acid export membrane protein